MHILLAEWVPIASLIASCIGLPTLAALIVTDLYRRKKEKRLENSAYEQERKEAELKKVVRTVVKEEVQPLIDITKSLQDDSPLIKQSLQATLRHDLYEIADRQRIAGYCPLDVKNDFENIYKCYHALGSNGVMDKTREEVMSLQTVKPAKKQVKKNVNAK